MAPLPWYAFLYRLLGAQGTFWLWVVCLVALWWTAKPTLHRVANRTPATRHVADVATTSSATDLTRWVSLTGVEVVYDRELLGQRSASAQSPVRLLLDPQDPAAQRWAELRALADAMQGEGDAAAQARKQFEARYSLLEGGDLEKLDPRPEPERVLVVQNGVVPTRAPLLASPPTDPLKWLAWMQARVDARAALVRERVHPSVTVQGLLVPMPETLAGRIKAQLEIDVGRWVVQQGREPRDLESWIFAAAAITLLFLATGFYGAVRAQRGDVAQV